MTEIYLHFTKRVFTYLVIRCPPLVSAMYSPMLKEDETAPERVTVVDPPLQLRVEPGPGPVQYNES